jgi:hypothetical protein
VKGDLTKRRHALGLAAALLLAGAALAATALAAGVKYVTVAESLPEDTRISIEAECTGGRAVSAGGSIAGETGTQTLGQRPIDGGDPGNKPGDAFEMRVDTPSVSGDLVTAYAICTDDEQKLKTKKATVAADGTGCDNAPSNQVCIVSRAVMCPKGTRITGGGVFVDTEFNARIRSSGPIDGPDGDPRPDDGWLGGANVAAPSGASQEVTIYAICSKSPKGLKYISESAFDGDQVTAECSTGQLIGGGSTVESIDEGLYVRHSIPVDNGDPNPKPDNAWEVSPVGAGGENVEAHAICRG